MTLKKKYREHKPGGSGHAKPSSNSTPKKKSLWAHLEKAAKGAKRAKKKI